MRKSTHKGHYCCEDVNLVTDVPFASTTFNAAVSKSVSGLPPTKVGGHLPLARTLSRILIVRISTRQWMMTLTCLFCPKCLAGWEVAYFSDQLNGYCRKCTGLTQLSSSVGYEEYRLSTCVHFVPGDCDWFVLCQQVRQSTWVFFCVPPLYAPFWVLDNMILKSTGPTRCLSRVALDHL